MKEDKKLTLIEHLEELRARLLKSIVFVIVVSALLYYLVDDILPFLIKPIGKLAFIAPAEAFLAYIKIAILGGIFLSSPFVIYQIWRFVSVGLKRDERVYAITFGPLSFLFFIAGGCFGYFVVMPIGLKFLLGFATDCVYPMITVSRYISFVGTLTLAFGVMFELPLATLFLTRLGLVTPRFLSARRRYALLSIFIIAAFLTPPDVITQFLMAIPLLILYEISILFSRLAYRPMP